MSKPSKVGTFANMSKVAPWDAANALISDALPEDKSVFTSKLCDGGDGGGGGDDDGCDGDGGDGDVLKVFPKILFHTYLAPGLRTGCTGKQGLPTCQLRRRTLRNNF